MARILQFPQFNQPENEEAPKEAGSTEPVEETKILNFPNKSVEETSNQSLADGLGDILERLGLADQFPELSGRYNKLHQLVNQIPASRRARLLTENQNIVSEYSDDDLQAWLRRPESEWTARPIFFYALYQEMLTRRGRV